MVFFLEAISKDLLLSAGHNKQYQWTNGENGGGPQLRRFCASCARSTAVTAAFGAAGAERRQGRPGTFGE